MPRFALSLGAVSRRKSGVVFFIWGLRIVEDAGIHVDLSPTLGGIFCSFLSGRYGGCLTPHILLSPVSLLFLLTELLLEYLRGLGSDDLGVLQRVVPSELVQLYTDRKVVEIPLDADDGFRVPDLQPCRYDAIVAWVSTVEAVFFLQLEPARLNDVDPSSVAKYIGDELNHLCLDDMIFCYVVFDHTHNHIVFVDLSPQLFRKIVIILL